MIFIILVLSLLFPNKLLAVDNGWDYNLTKRCIKSPNPNGVNYYQDISQCDNSSKNWTVAVQSEKTLGVSCGGVVNQSLPINTPDSPLSLNWTPHQDEGGVANWQVDLITDLTSKTHSCGDNNFTWYTLMDNVSLHGGSFSLPNKVQTQVQVKINQQNNQNVATRNFVAWQGFWKGKSHAIEINFNITPNWGDANPDPDIIQTINDGTIEYVVMNGKPLNIWSDINETKTLTVNWPTIINDLIARGYFTKPTDWQNTATTAMFVGSEVNNFTATNAGKNTLSVTNFRNYEISPGDYNHDTKIDLVDFSFWKTQYLQNLMTLADFAVWKSAYLLN